MKKFILSLMASLFLMGGVAMAQDGVADTLSIDDMGIQLPQEEESNAEDGNTIMIVAIVIGVAVVGGVAYSVIAKKKK